MASEKSSNELQSFLKVHPDVQLLELLLPDMNGILRGKRLSSDEFAKVFGEGVTFCASAVIMDTKGATFESVCFGNSDGDLSMPIRRPFNNLADLLPVNLGIQQRGERRGGEKGLEYTSVKFGKQGVATRCRYGSVKSVVEIAELTKVHTGPELLRKLVQHLALTSGRTNGREFGHGDLNHPAGLEKFPNCLLCPFKGSLYNT